MIFQTNAERSDLSQIDMFFLTLHMFLLHVGSELFMHKF